MTVISIPQAQKEALAQEYAFGLSSINDLVHSSGRSRCTIIRVLQEAGVYAPRAWTRKTQFKHGVPFDGISTDEIAFLFSSPVDIELPIPVPEYEADMYTLNLRTAGSGMSMEEDLAHEPMVAARPAILNLIDRVKRFFAAA